jgi:hypothetical protein
VAQVAQKLTAQQIVALEAQIRLAKAQDAKVAEEVKAIKQARKEQESAQVVGLSVERNEQDDGWLFRLDLGVSDEVMATYEPSQDGRKYFLKNLAQRNVECVVGDEKAVLGLAGVFCIAPKAK